MGTNLEEKKEEEEVPEKEKEERVEKVEEEEGEFRGRLQGISNWNRPTVCVCWIGSQTRINRARNK